MQPVNIAIVQTELDQTFICTIYLTQIFLCISKDPVVSIEILDSDRHQRVRVTATRK